MPLSQARFVLALSASLLPLQAHAVEQLIPAGSVIQCTVAEPKISSKTQNVGDPVLCQVSHVELYGRSVFPYGSYLEGHFEAYQDPGHFVGKGWMELKFDRLIVGNDTIVPISARVVSTPKYPVDKDGRIHGTGHPVRDAVEWAIPVLWPIDLINLPRRGPRPVLKAETRLTLKLLDDLGIPSPDEVAQSQPALVSRNQIAAPIVQNYPQQPPPQQAYQQPAYPQQMYAPQQPSYPPSQTIIYQYAAPQQPAPVIIQMQAPMPPPVTYVYPPRPRYYPGPYGYYRPY